METPTSPCGHPRRVVPSVEHRELLRGHASAPQVLAASGPARIGPVGTARRALGLALPPVAVVMVVVVLLLVTLSGVLTHKLVVVVVVVTH